MMQGKTGEPSLPLPLRLRPWLLMSLKRQAQWLLTKRQRMKAKIQRKQLQKKRKAVNMDKPLRPLSRKKQESRRLRDHQWG